MNLQVTTVEVGTGWLRNLINSLRSNVGLSVKAKVLLNTSHRNRFHLYTA